MGTNYLDTLTMYHTCTTDIRNCFKRHWIWDNSNTDVNLHHFCIKTPYCFVRYFPDMYRRRVLYVTFSLPKLYYQCNNNAHHVTDYDNGTFMDILHAELDTVMDTSILPTSLKDWQPSRVDLFRTRTINPADRKEYLYGYSRRSYRGHGAHNYKNTDYLGSGKDFKKSGIVEREYNKTVEMQDKRSLLFGNLPVMVENEHENLMNDIDIPEDMFRYEFSLRRGAIVRFIRKYNLPLNMETVMDENFQSGLLNDLVLQRKLNHEILSKKEYRELVRNIFKTKHSQDLALKLAESIRNRKPSPISQSQRYRIARVLDSYNADTATTGYVSINGLKLL